jgi:5-methylcytosine-specific restriction enzyme subunit McrC
MLRLTVLERGRLERAAELSGVDSLEGFGSASRRRVPAFLFDRLQRAEGIREDRGEKAIFRWGRNKAYVGPWVGVLQVPGLQLEILPKIETEDSSDPLGETDLRDNLLHMLSLAGITKVRERGMADLGRRKGMLHDQLVSRFVERLLAELRRGVDRTYAEQHDNLLALRGRLVLKQQLTRNAAHKHRFYCRFDALAEHTQLNRLLRSACDALRTWSVSQPVLRGLVEATALLQDVHPFPDHRNLPEVVFNRQNERFRDLYEFAVMVLRGQAPNARAGQNQTFSLLFDMDKVFEGYIASFLQRFVVPKLEGVTLHPQARNFREYLFEPADEGGGASALRLSPDLLFRYPDEKGVQQVFIIDTKWKRLSNDRGSRPSNADLYQLYAYLHRYGCQQAFLLYPAVHGLSTMDYRAVSCSADPMERTVGVRFANLRRSLWLPAEREALAEDLRSTVLQGLTNYTSKPVVMPRTAAGVA